MPLCHILSINTVVVLARIDVYGIGNMCFAKYVLPLFMSSTTSHCCNFSCCCYYLGQYKKVVNYAQLLCHLWTAVMTCIKLQISNQSLQNVKKVNRRSKFCMQFFYCPLLLFDDDCSKQYEMQSCFITGYQMSLYCS